MWWLLVIMTRYFMQRNSEWTALDFEIMIMQCILRTKKVGILMYGSSPVSHYPLDHLLYYWFKKTLAWWSATLNGFQFIAYVQVNKFQLKWPQVEGALHLEIYPTTGTSQIQQFCKHQSRETRKMLIGLTRTPHYMGYRTGLSSSLLECILCPVMQNV